MRRFKENDQIKREDLVNSFSRHAKLSNRYMLGILLCSFLYIIHYSSYNTSSNNITAYNISGDNISNNNISGDNISDKKTYIEFLFLGKISFTTLNLVTISLLSCLMIVFSSVHLMALRIREYYYQFFKSSKDKDYFDLIVDPTIFRTKPITWMLFYRNIFFYNKYELNDKTKTKKNEERIYRISKRFVIVITYFFPTFILIYTNIRNIIFSINIINIIFSALLAFLSLFSIFCFYVTYRNEKFYIEKGLKEGINKQ